MEYVDFELEIGAGRGREYPVSVLRSPVGEARGTMRFPFDRRSLSNQLLVLENALLRSGVTSSVRRGAAPSEAPLRGFGETLFGALFTGDVLTCYEQSLRQVIEERRGKGLRLKLRLQAPELAALPWEFLYDPKEGEYVCLQRRTPLVRYLADPRHPPQPLAVTPPLRVLGLIASPKDLDPLDVAAERARIEEALRELRQGSRVELVWVPGQSASELQTAMLRGPWHVFHFIGHGGFDEARKEGVLALADGAGNADWLTATQVGRLLDDHDPLRLAVLNACDGARGDTGDLFSSTAATLVRRGVPAVLAMQYPVSDTAAIQFSSRFYEAVAYGLAVDAAVAEARITVSVATRNSAEWGAPVLYTRSPDGQLFDISARDAERPSEPASSAAADPSAAEQRLAGLWTEALAHFYTERWREAAEALRSIVAERPDYRDAAAKLAEAERRARLTERYAAAERALAARSWAEGAEQLRAVVAEDAGYRDAAALLAQAEKQQRLQQLYDEAKELHRTGAWSAVVGVFDRIAELDPAYPDPDGLLTAARQALAADERERGLNALLSQAVAHIDAGAWPQAVKVLEELQRQQPGYRESAALLERARQEVGRADEADRQERLRRLYVEAEDASAVGNWPRAVERLEALAAVDGAYRDTAVRLAEARRQKRLAELYAEARQHARAQEWPSVVESFAQIQALDPSYPDDEGLLQSARAAQARADQERRLAELYAAAVQAMDGGALDRAVQHLEAIRAIDPGYRDAAALLTRARSTAGGDGTVRRALVLLGGGLLAVALLLGVLLGRRPLGELLRTAATATPSAPPATATPAPTATAMPTVVPATAVPVSTPAATPTVAPPSPAATRPPAATPTPVWWIYAEEKFDKPQGLLEPLLLDSVGLTRKYEGGKYVMRKSDPALSVVLRARLPDRFADARLAIDANLEGDATNRYLALSCRDQWESDQAAGEQLSGYGLLVDPARGRLALARWDKSKETLLRGWEASTALKRGNQPNRLELSCSGTTIAARVNGTPVASVEDSGYQRGRFWIGAGEIGGVAVSGPTEARFDNLVVTIAQ